MLKMVVSIIKLPQENNFKSCESHTHFPFFIWSPSKELKINVNNFSNLLYFFTLVYRMIMQILHYYNI